MKWTKIGRTGLHTAMSGQQVQLTEADFDKVVATYNPKDHEAPLVLGHPVNNGPAFGWVDSLKREGEYLLAQFAQVPDSLKKAVDNGHYKKVSMSLYPDGTLRHVGLLGATPPAIKGLGDINLGSGEDTTEIHFDFSETPGQPAPNQPDIPGTENTMGDKELIEKLKADNARLEKEKADADKSAADANKAKEAAEKSFAEAQAAKAKEARTAKVDALIKDGKVLPAEKDRILAFAERLGGKPGDEICFSEGEGKKAVEDHFFNWLEGRQAHGLFDFSSPDQKPGGEESINTSGLAAKF
jgi:hypothetical protein